MKKIVIPIMCAAIVTQGWGQPPSTPASQPKTPETPLKALETKLKMERMAIPGPQPGANRSEWLADLKQYRELKLAELKYNGSEYDRPELKWCQSSFIQPQMMVEDRYFYDVEKGKYTVDRYLDDLEKRYGGIDSVLVWCVYPNIGIDNQNQFDQFRAMPGGVPAMKQMVADFHRRNVKVLFGVMPWWEKGSRSEGVTLPVAIARDMKAVGADGVNGDTMVGMMGDYSYRSESDKTGHPVAFEPEGGLNAGEKELSWINMTWGYWSNAQNSDDVLGTKLQVPPVSKYKWLEPRHMVHVNDRWIRDRNLMMQSAFFNGTGYESWESIWCVWNGFTPRDGESLRRTATILRAYADLLVSKDWEPHVSTLQKGVFASRFPGPKQTLWTLINRFASTVTGPQLRLPYIADVRYFDLWHGVELKPEIEDKEAVLSFEMEGYGFGSVLAIEGAPDAKLTSLIEKMHTYSAKRLADFSSEWKFLPQTQVPISATVPAKATPLGMTRIPAGTFEFIMDGIEFEGGHQAGVDVQYPWENSPRRNHRQYVTLKSFYIDTYPVTNEQFKTFVDEAKYRPRDDYNFLKDWKNGTYPEGWGKKPVTWVSLEDARAYAAWAGKRLPHETEWHYAAQGTDGRKYPWGNELNAEAIPPEYKDNKELRPPTDVDAFPKGASPFGVMDMAGNVWQWTDEYHDEHSRGGILRGGSYFKPQGSVWYFPNKLELNTHGKLLLMAPSKDRAGTLGFRCVVDAAE
jgi:formylglycine-generating enzyme required for sulfatase activity